MRQLGETELFGLKMSAAEQQAIGNAITLKLNQNVGRIAPEHITPELAQLRSKSKNSYFPLIADALSLYENRGLIRLFNLGAANNGRTPIPTYMPFVPGIARNRVKESDPTIPNEQARDRAIFINMYRIGNWSADETTYQGLSANTDLYACLENGVVMYNLIVQGKQSKIFNDKVVVENLARIYTNLFAQCVVKCRLPFGNGGTDDFGTDTAYFIIARFFLKYILQYTSEDLIDNYALLCIKNKSSRVGLKSYEETANINYDSLSGFLKSFGETFFQDPISLAEFEIAWTKSYGDCTALAIEYVPYFIYDLFATYDGALLGGTLRMGRFKENLKKLGLGKLRIAIINNIR